MNNICTLGRSMDEECKLEYVKPICVEGKLFAATPRWEINENIQRWSNMLVGYVIGDNHSIFT